MQAIGGVLQIEFAVAISCIVIPRWDETSSNMYICNIHWAKVFCLKPIASTHPFTSVSSCIWFTISENPGCDVVKVVVISTFWYIIVIQQMYQQVFVNKLSRDKTWFVIQFLDVAWKLNFTHFTLYHDFFINLHFWRMPNFGSVRYLKVFHFQCFASFLLTPWILALAWQLEVTSSKLLMKFSVILC
jgi:hypothetical protein